LNPSDAFDNCRVTIDGMYQLATECPYSHNVVIGSTEYTAKKEYAVLSLNVEYETNTGKLQFPQRKSFLYTHI